MTTKTGFLPLLLAKLVATADFGMKRVGKFVPD
jgi:hypothetical protein